MTNTATQIQIMEALGFDHPEFAHHSLLTGPQGEALSKRLGTLALRDLREQGVQPMALLSLMARLGSSDPVELRTDMAALIEGFDVSRFGTAPTKFDVQDVFPMTARYLQTQSADDVQSELDALGVPAETQSAFWDVTRENITTLGDLAQWWSLCQEGAEPLIADEDQEFVAQAMTLLPEGPYDSTSWKTWTTAVKDATGRKGKGLFMPLRKAVTGMERGPDMGALLPLMQVVRARG